MAKYHSKLVDKQGYVDWDDEEHQVWTTLVSRQIPLVEQRACQPYIEGLKSLALPMDSVPQLPAINAVLQQTTGWRCAPVPALINFDRFFALLADKQFPVATFLRHRDEMDYLQEPDYFHEIFGHCAMLTHPDFAAFTAAYGKLGLNASHEERVFLARLYWFTVEFGLLKEGDKLKIYGGGILSSPAESVYALESDQAERQLFSVLDVLRTPYRIDILQPIYFYLQDIADLYRLSQADLRRKVQEAKQLGLFAPKFEPKESVHA
ncbi:phenylalanine 4-monooxygenase [Thaumasiovibrio subtropicus]|uniref:phenylalanine 4-monooxygenase n=1 Tax=Thaumasiovibrio subtropicus TaxID=1891207 RepID=UPI000B358E98|nr:phenylalanine 4-monooxygenase [Thaumasiovibrio subtropicus]